jgi:hypothetical protein
VQDLHVDIGHFLEGLERLSSSLAHVGVEALRIGVRVAEKSAKETTLFKDQTGTTRGSIRGEIAGRESGFVRAGGAASLLQAGTRPHTIVARGRALRFVVAGAVMFRRSVLHPGTQPRPFMTQARDAGERAIIEALPVLVREAIARTR